MTGWLKSLQGCQIGCSWVRRYVYRFLKTAYERSGCRIPRSYNKAFHRSCKGWFDTSIYTAIPEKVLACLLGLPVWFRVVVWLFFGDIQRGEKINYKYLAPIIEERKRRNHNSSTKPVSEFEVKILI